MKVFQINVTGNLSTGKIAVDLYRMLIANNDDCIIAYGRGIIPKDIKSVHIGNKFDNCLHAIGTRVTDKHGLYSSQATKELCDIMRTYDPDVIHLHNLHGYYLNIKSLFEFLKEFNKPVVWTLHDCWTFTGHCAYFDDIGCEKWKIECSNCSQKKQYPKSIVLDRSNYNYHLKKALFNNIKNMIIITPSQWLADLTKQSFLGNYTIKVIHNGIDTGLFKPSISNFREKYNLKDKYIILGVASTWDHRKGLNAFIELSKHVNDNYKIILIGLSKNQLKKIPQNILGFQRTNNVQELIDIYSAADVTANLSTEESFGLVTIESMACGTPVIVYNSTASPELVNESTGLIISGNNIEELINALNKIKSHGKKYYSNSCRRHIIENFNKDDKYIENIRLYNLLILGENNEKYSIYL